MVCAAEHPNQTLDKPPSTLDRRLLEEAITQSPTVPEGLEVKMVI